MATVSYLVHCDTFLQNATDIVTKYYSYYITKSMSFFITKCNSHYKMWQLLQNATFITKCVYINMYYLDVTSKNDVK